MAEKKEVKNEVSSDSTKREDLKLDWSHHKPTKIEDKKSEK